MSYYWLPVIPICFLIMIIEAATEKFRMKETRRGLCAGFLLLIAGCSMGTMLSWLPSLPRATHGLSSVGEWLVENGYSKGYSTFWNANVLTELTDGSIEMWAVDLNDLYVINWLQLKSHLDAPKDGPVFVLTTEQEKENLTYKDLESHLAYSDENGWYVYVYQDADVLQSLLATE